MITFSKKLKQVEAELLTLTEEKATMTTEVTRLFDVNIALQDEIAELRAQLEGNTLVSENAELKTQVTDLIAQVEAEEMDLAETISQLALEITAEQGVPPIANEPLESPTITKVDILGEMAKLPASARQAFFNQNKKAIVEALKK